MQTIIVFGFLITLVVSLAFAAGLWRGELRVRRQNSK